MPLFFFHLYEELPLLDQEGRELADFAAAESYGLKEARTIAADQVMEGHLRLWHRIEIADVGNRVLKTIHFSDAVRVTTQ